ncbi:hypothetical protein L198_05866 [Cryptococcus wingfieldii CBS 7118]|uniref:Uncharacterized protein n=1 Tax=Cryptococcus wingfieldii CBS 7118 TaxID=1295528 RepID=A0A1E3ISC2_9TREE|nr:hypothetical protein L198_05866 [Cryptococcus wingfieldii CBS 7118]ODN91355.1 hypothetical protein L198_05866 [Cryptococcus wingfieldii CBS 7118]
MPSISNSHLPHLRLLAAIRKAADLHLGDKVGQILLSQVETDDLALIKHAMRAKFPILFADGSRFVREWPIESLLKQRLENSKKEARRKAQETTGV